MLYNADCLKESSLKIEECVFIDYIIHSLKAFKESNIDKIDIHRLSLCYNHIINVHSFCSDFGKRQKLKDHVCGLVGVCQKGKQCDIVSKHATRRYENKQQSKAKDPSKEVLMACLCSLHSYLLHNDNELYRLRTNDSSHRFCSNPLAVKDEMDVFMQFVA